MSDPKPIFTIGLPSTTSKADISTIKEVYSIKMRDYHVLVYRNTSDETVFKAFYSKDIVTIESLKELEAAIKEMIEKGGVEG